MADALIAGTAATGSVAPRFGRQSDRSIVARPPPQVEREASLPLRVQGAGMLGVAAVPTTSGVRLTWTPAGGFTHFGTQRRPAPGAGIPWEWVHRYLGTASRDLDGTAAPGESYEYRVIGRRSRRGPDVLRSAVATVTAGGGGGATDRRLPDIQPPGGVAQEPNVTAPLVDPQPQPATAAEPQPETKTIAGVPVTWILIGLAAVGLALTLMRAG